MSRMNFWLMTVSMLANVLGDVYVESENTHPEALDVAYRVSRAFPMYYSGEFVSVFAIVQETPNTLTLLRSSGYIIDMALTSSSHKTAFYVDIDIVIVYLLFKDFKTQHLFFSDGLKALRGVMRSVHDIPDDTCNITSRNFFCGELIPHGPTLLLPDEIAPKYSERIVIFLWFLFSFFAVSVVTFVSRLNK